MKYFSSFFNPSTPPQGFIEKQLNDYVWIHDANFTIYDSETDEWDIYEVSKMSGSKHARTEYDPKKHIDKFLNITDNRNVKFDYLFNGQKNDGVMQPYMGWNEDINGIVPHKKWLYGTSHHVSHAYAAFIQSPFNSCMWISFDGGSHEGKFVWGWFDEESHRRDVKWEKYQIGSEYGAIGDHTRGMLHKDTDFFIDIPGKMMGLAAYGTAKKTWVEDILSGMNNPPDLPYNACAPWISKSEKIKILNSIGEKKYGMLMRRPSDNVYKIIKNFIINDFKNDQEFMDLVASTQYAYECFLIDFLKDKEHLLNRTNRRLILTGGSALNVLANEKIKNTYGLNVYVPPNPGDDSQSFGMLSKYLINDSKKWDLKKRANITFRGMPLIETPQEVDNVISSNGAKPITHKEITELLEDGKILGVIIGRSEIGPRALGHRSILCDPSFSDMKDTLNKKVKFREWFRPFAPMCRKEDAITYFDSHNFENMEYMSFAPMVKPEYRKQLPSITHKDGSSRLQIIDKNNVELEDIYKILSLKRKHKVLLNTSFNIQGKPILNSLSDALWMLDNTGLDHVIIKHNDTFFKFG